MKIRIGDWFVLYQMSKNLNKRFFYDFLINLSRENCLGPMLLAENGTYCHGPAAPTTDQDDTVAYDDDKKLIQSPSTPMIIKNDSDEPPPLIEGPPRTLLKKIHTA